MNDDQPVTTLVLRKELQVQRVEFREEFKQAFASFQAQIQQEMDRRFAEAKSENDKSFELLFKYMQDGFSKLHERLDTKAEKADTSAIYGLLDTYIKHKEDNDAEQAAIKHQLNRYEHWHQTVARKLNITLDY